MTDRDIVTKIFAKKVNFDEISVSEILTQDLLSIHYKQDVLDTINALAKKGVRRAPIVNDENKVIGIMALDDLFLLIAEELQGLAKLIKKQISL